MDGVNRRCSLPHKCVRVEDASLAKGEHEEDYSDQDAGETARQLLPPPARAVPRTAGYDGLMDRKAWPRILTQRSGKDGFPDQS